MLEDLGRLLAKKDKKILFAGLGNVLRKDDGIGVYIADRIRQQENISSITVETGFENYIGKINSMAPDILILVDCADRSHEPGDSELVLVGDIQDMTFNTHNISLKRISEFFLMPVYVLAIQPEKIDFGENISYIVKNKADQLINYINQRR